MARPRNPVPTYRRHRSTDRAFVVLNGRQVYLGRYGTPESKTAYARLVASLKSADRPSPAAQPAEFLSRPGCSMAELCADFAERQFGAYSRSETRHFVLAMEFLLREAGQTPAAGFGPLALTRVRDAMVSKGWTRQHVNAQVRRI